MRIRRKSNPPQDLYDKTYRKKTWIEKQKSKLREKTCQNCLKTFLTTRGNKSYCTRYCMRVVQRKNWITNNLEKHRLMRRQHTAARRNGLDVSTIQKVYEKNILKNGTLSCCLCLEKIIFGDDSLEHKTPVSRGGSNHPSNLDVAHISCNKKKNSKTMAEYRKWQLT